MNTDIVVKNYEVYCRKFSQVIQAENITIAMNEFYSSNPAEEIIIVENIEARNESLTEVKEQQGECVCSHYYDFFAPNDNGNVVCKKCGKTL